MVTKKPSKRKVSRHRKRIVAIQGALVVALGAVAWRIYFVQSQYGTRLLATADAVQQATKVVLAERGSILDSTGHPLAYDVPAFMMDVEPSAFTDLPKLAGLLSPILGKPQSDILTFLQGSSKGWVQWQTPVLEPAKESILSSKEIAALAVKQVVQITFTPTEQRLYPYGDFAANVIGYVNQSGQGLGGLEAEYNKQLSGSNGEVSYTQDRWGFPLQSSLRTIVKSSPGDNLELTLDQTIQSYVENQMNQLVAQYKPENATIIVMDPNSGAILGMASRPTFNPNTYWNALPRALSNNFALADFEPGSTFKVMVLAAALATHTIQLDQTFMSGHLTVYGRRINDWKWGGWGRITFQQALEYSSNVGFATIALKLGWTNMLQYMQAFGYLNKTGIDLPAESTPLIFPPSSQGPVQLATTGFGQGIAVTPVQQMAAIAAIANGGTLYRPHLAKALIDPTTQKVVQEFAPVVVNPQVAPPDVVDTVRNTMILDVSQGIDTQGQIPGYDVAGKTGTAQVVDSKTKQYYANRFIVSFIGYAPGTDPKIEVMVSLEWPKTAAGNQWGSTIATPAARQILEECLQYYHIQPNLSASALAATSKTSTKPSQLTHYVAMPDLKGDTLKNAKDTIQKLGLHLIAMGGSGTISQQWPDPGTVEPAGANVYSYGALVAKETLQMPNLIGVSMRDAGDMLAAMGLTLIPNGSGYAVSQSIAPGTKIQAGTSVAVNFAPPKDPTDAAVAAALQQGKNANSTGNSTGNQVG